MSPICSLIALAEGKYVLGGVDGPHPFLSSLYMCMCACQAKPAVAAAPMQIPLSTSPSVGSESAPGKLVASIDVPNRVVYLRSSAGAVYEGGLVAGPEGFCLATFEKASLNYKTEVPNLLLQVKPGEFKNERKARLIRSRLRCRRNRVRMMVRRVRRMKKKKIFGRHGLF